MSANATIGMNTDAIAAVCTAPGCAGIAVVRLSGRDALAIADRFCGERRRTPSSMPAGTFRLFRLRDPEDGSFIDEALVLVFRAPHSYTGEDVVEFQTHGGRVPVLRVMQALLACGARPAEPGAFSRRAFLNGRIDLSMAEAVMDVIGAQSERAERAAVEQLGGALGRRIDACYDALMAVCADIEASLDFADDESNDVLDPADLPGRLEAVREDLSALAATWREGVLLREGARVVISGVPNAGKSTLFNALLGMFRAIVTDIPGTTRDAIEETMLLDGIPLRMIDTAGLRETDSTIERLGIDRAKALIATADLNLRLVDVSAPHEPQLEWLKEDDGRRETTLVVLSKVDLGCDGAALLDRIRGHGFDVIGVSARDGINMEALKAAMVHTLLGGGRDADSAGVAVSQRHHGLIVVALEQIGAARALLLDRGGDAAVFCAQMLRAGSEALAQITGRVYSEDLLDRVFSRFCIGK